MKYQNNKFIPKKRFGQNFLVDNNVINSILEAIDFTYKNETTILEIGPGLGALTEYLIKKYKENIILVEIDNDLHDRLANKYPESVDKIINADFLELDLEKISTRNLTVVGNIPYNISGSIFFKLLENRHLVSHIIFTVQREVALRLAAKPNSKSYGIPSVLMQTFYNIEYLFSIPPTAFHPIPKVTSAVVRLTRNSVERLNCDETIFFNTVKRAFNKRRKTLKNSLQNLLPKNLNDLDHKFLNLRAEQISVEEYINLAIMLNKNKPACNLYPSLTQK